MRRGRVPPGALNPDTIAPRTSYSVTLFFKALGRVEVISGVIGAWFTMVADTGARGRVQPQNVSNWDEDQL